MIDLSLDLREAIVAHLRGDPNVTALVPANRIFGEYAGTQPQFPFIRMGYQDATGWEATCWEGSENNFSIHAFAENDAGYTNDIAIIAKRVLASMQQFEPAFFDLVDLEWVRTNVLPDEVPTVLHAAMDFRVVAVVEA